MSTNTNAVQTQEGTIFNFIEKRKSDIARLLPAGRDIDRFIKSAALVIYNSTDLQACSPGSVITALFNAAQTGLDFTPIKGHAYMVPFKGKATFMPGYRGFIHLVTSEGVAKKVEARVVFENDEFEFWYGTSPGLKHVPARKNGGNPVAAYAYAKLADGEIIFEVMDMDDLNAIRARSKARDAGPWKTDTNEMYRKTVIRRLFKYLPGAADSEALVKAVEFDNEAVGFGDTPAEHPEYNEVPEVKNGDTPITQDQIAQILTRCGTEKIADAVREHVNGELSDIPQSQLQAVFEYVDSLKAGEKAQSAPDDSPDSYLTDSQAMTLRQRIKGDDAVEKKIVKQFSQGEDITKIIQGDLPKIYAWIDDNFKAAKNAKAGQQSLV